MEEVGIGGWSGFREEDSKSISSEGNSRDTPRAEPGRGDLPGTGWECEQMQLCSFGKWSHLQCIAPAFILHQQWAQRVLSATVAWLETFARLWLILTFYAPQWTKANCCWLVNICCITVSWWLMGCMGELEHKNCQKVSFPNRSLQGHWDDSTK